MVIEPRVEIGFTKVEEQILKFSESILTERVFVEPFIFS